MSKISLETAVKMTAFYRRNSKSILAVGINPEILPICETFPKKEIELLLNQERCEGLRIYYSMDEALNLHAVIVAVNENDEDILNEEDPEILDDARKCPPNCPPESPLNP